MAPGVQVKSPFVVMLAPSGGTGSRENVSVWLGRSASVAVTLKLKSVPTAAGLVPTGVTMGAVLTSRTTTVTVCVLDRAGVPSSVTTRVNRLVAGPWASVGFQVKTPLADTLAPGATSPTRLKVSSCNGQSESVAAAAKAIATPSSAINSPMAANCGGVLVWLSARTLIRETSTPVISPM